MYDGVKAMIEREKELKVASTLKPGDVQAGPRLKKPEDLTGFPVFGPDVKSLLSRNLTRQMWE